MRFVCSGSFEYAEDPIARVAFHFETKIDAGSCLGSAQRRSMADMFDQMNRLRLTDEMSVEVKAFTPCTPADSLLVLEEETAGVATAGDLVRSSPACSSFGRSVTTRALLRPGRSRNAMSIYGGASSHHHKMMSRSEASCLWMMKAGGLRKILQRGFVRENLEANKSTLTSRQLNQRQENE